MRRYNLGYKLYYIVTIMFFPVEIPFQFKPNQKITPMPNFDIMEGRIKCLLMAAAQNEQRTLGHLAKE